MNAIELLKIIGGFAGILALSWKIIEELKVFLRIKIEAEKNGDDYSVLTEIENTSRFFNKKIKNAFLIICKEEADLIEVGNSIAKHLNIDIKIDCTNVLNLLQPEKPIYLNNEISIIPLDFYYSENIRIGDEKLTYRCSINNENFESGNYSVRLFIYGEKRFHRSTQDLIHIDKVKE
jgi:hypothetical protein